MTDEHRTEAGTIDAGAVRDALRRVAYPGYDRDIVSFGLVDRIEVGAEGVRVSLVVETDEEGVPERLRSAAEAELRDIGCEGAEVEVRRPEGLGGAPPPGPGTAEDGAAESGPAAGGGRPMTPLQAELAEEGTPPEPDPLSQVESPPGTAPDAGYAAGGPSPIAGPGGVGREDRADGDAAEDASAETGLRVYQWEIDPRDEDLPGGDAELESDDWHFRMWWREHPEGPVYASIQALRSDPGRPEGDDRQHPVGRAVAVNLVYAPAREAVVAVYGTVRDFRPFVRAFEEAYRPTSGGRDDHEEAEEADETDITDGSEG